MVKVRIKPSDACKFRKAPKTGVIYECGYFVRDPKDGWTYIVDFPTLLTGKYEPIFDVYWENESDIESLSA